MSSSGSAVRAKSLRFAYRNSQSPALDGFDLDLAEGELCALAGPTGAGKSTFTRTLNAIVPCFTGGRLEGELAVFGEPVAGKRVADLAGVVGMVLQDFESQLFSTNVTIEVAFGPESLGVPSEEIRSRVRESLEAVGLHGFEKRDPATLSGGEKQRLAIASVLAMRPRLLVLDEPTTDLDPLGREGVLAALEEAAARGITILLVEHGPEELARSHSLGIVRDGKLVARGTTAEVQADPERLRAAGVEPHAIPELFQRLGLPERPLDEETAFDLLTRRGFRSREAAQPAVIPSDGARQNSSGEIVIELEGLTHAFPGTRALDEVSLRVRKGEFVALLGQNGSGKTTLAKHLNGLLRPTGGRVLVGGEDISKKRTAELARRVGYVFQNPDHQIFAHSVFDEVAFGLRNLRLGEDRIPARVAASLDVVGLGGAEGRDPFILTRGERQRLAVASVLAMEPEVLVLDEPTTGLDYTDQTRMLSLIERLNHEGHTILMITHSMGVAARYARRTVVLRDGRVILDGPTREVLGRDRELASASLKPPVVTRLSRRFGLTCLSVEELAESLISPAPPPGGASAP